MRYSVLSGLGDLLSPNVAYTECCVNAEGYESKVVSTAESSWRLSQCVVNRVGEIRLLGDLWVLRVWKSSELL
jgi:hypothetical protein